MAMTEQQKINYRREYNEKNYARIGLYVSPEEKALWQEEAKKRGVDSLNKFIKDCVNVVIGGD